MMTSRTAEAQRRQRSAERDSSRAKVTHRGRRIPGRHRTRSRRPFASNNRRPSRCAATKRSAASRMPRETQSRTTVRQSRASTPSARTTTSQTRSTRCRKSSRGLTRLSARRQRASATSGQIGWQRERGRPARGSKVSTEGHESEAGERTIAKTRMTLVKLVGAGHEREMLQA